MSTYVPSPSAPKAPRDQRLQFKGRNGVSVLAEAYVTALQQSELVVSFASVRKGEAPPAWLAGPTTDVLTLLYGMVSAAEAEAERQRQAQSPEEGPGTPAAAPDAPIPPCAAV